MKKKRIYYAAVDPKDNGAFMLFKHRSWAETWLDSRRKLIKFIEHNCHCNTSCICAQGSTLDCPVHDKNWIARCDDCGEKMDKKTLLFFDSPKNYLLKN